jgi:hypothetical protein
VPTEKLGYSYVQSKLGTNVIDIQGFAVGPGVQLIAVARKYDGFENQAWGVRAGRLTLGLGLTMGGA